MRGEEFRRRFEDSARSRDQLLSEVLSALCVKARHLGWRLGVVDEAEQADVVHATLLWLLDGGAATLDPARDIHGYLYAVMRNRFFDILRARKVTVAWEAADDDEDDRPRAERRSLADGEYTQLILSLDSTCFGQAYAALAAEPVKSGRLRVVDVIDFLANAEEPPTGEQLAAFFGTAPGAARERKSQALKKLRRVCEQLCGDDSCTG